MQAGVGCKDQQVELTEFVKLVYRFTSAVSALAEADNEPDPDLLKQARYLRDHVIPLMQTVRELADQLEMTVAADLWPLPSYREMLFSL
jgi:glutamine synthetase